MIARGSPAAGRRRLRDRRILRSGVALLMAAGSLAQRATAAGPSPWCATPLAQWTEAASVEGWGGGIDERYYEWKGRDAYEKRWAEFHRPAGTWREKSGALAIVGRTDRWTTRLLPNDGGPDQRFTARFVVQASSGADLELPHMQVPVRWGFHWGENLPGWDFGVVLRYQDPLNFYRVMLSAQRGELALWDSTGGFLQIVPCPVRLGTPHRLDITARAAHFQIAFDGRPVVDYWDRTLPHLRGQVGLSAWKSEVRVEQFEAAATAAESAPVPPHRPDFRFDTNRLLRVTLVTGRDAEQNFLYQTVAGVALYDGYEPISVFVKHPPDGGFYQGAVKLKPGWRAAYYSQMGPALNYKWPTLVGDLPEALEVEGGGETIGYRFRTVGLAGARGHGECTVRYEAGTGVYRYEYRVRQTFTNEAPLDIYNYQPLDPLTYNNRSPGPEVEHRWNAAGHRWWVYQGTNGQWRRVPMVDYLLDYNNPTVQWGKATDFLYPDPAACPSFEVDYAWGRTGRWTTAIGLCTWGYDFHHWMQAPGVPKMGMKAGSELTYGVTLAALLPDEARQRFEASALREGLETNATRLIMFDPRGGPLETTTWQDPQATMLWNGILDATVGREGRPSLRLDGPGSAGVYLYQYMVEQYAKRWWVRGWFRTKGLRGRGVSLRVKYAYANEPEEIFYMGGTGDQDWTRFSFVTTALMARDCSELLFETDGPGRVWLDGVAVSGLKADDKPDVTRFRMPRRLRPDPVVLIDWSMAEAPEKAVYDESRNGHALVLKGPEWKEEDGKGYLHFAGQQTAHVSFKPVLQGKDRPPEVTQSMLEACGMQHESYRPVFPLKEFTYEWWMRPMESAKNLGRMTLFRSRLNPVCSVTPGSAKDGEGRLSYQGDIFCGAKIRLEHAVPYGQWTHVAVTHGDGKVRLYVNGQKAGEAEYDPKGPGFWMNRPGLDFGQRYGGDLGPFRLYARALRPKEVSDRCRVGWMASKP